eukprot:jgi/Chlat1/219/Chrsp1S03038
MPPREADVGPVPFVHDAEAEAGPAPDHSSAAASSVAGRWDVVIVGAGVAGSALAFALGSQGRRVLVLERDLTEPDRIVGELLQPGGYLALTRLGLESAVDAIDAQRVKGYCIYLDGQEAQLEYPLENYGPSVAGRSFHNGRFIMRMRAAAAALPTVKLIQATVTSLVEDQVSGAVVGVSFKGPDGWLLHARGSLTFVCDGCFSRLRKGLSKSEVSAPSSFVGLILENCELPHPNHGHVVLADPSPVLFYPISSTEVRCLVDIAGKLPSQADGSLTKHMLSHVLPQLPVQLQESFSNAVQSGRMRTMPNKTMPADPVHVSSCNTAAVATHLHAFYTRRKPMAATVNTLAGALYRVFCKSEDDALNEMRQACFDYLQLGGNAASGPVALLSGLNPSPMSLVAHFFAVAGYGVGRLLLPPTPHKMWLGARLLTGAAKIILPIIKAEGIRQVFFPFLIRRKRVQLPAKDDSCESEDQADVADQQHKRLRND